MIIPLIYYICIAIWLPRNAVERAQYLIGLVIFTFCGPFINISVLLYAVYNMDSFGWGKTRQVVTEETDNDSDTGISSLISLGSRHLPGDEESQVVSEKPTRDTPFTASPGISGLLGSNSCREGGA
jgi:chitin synthase